ncbi:hypothetical protein DB345_03045 [Spartobacteria bacterium LR76]|nr:hypothetical protein DB345_03045 [Spartobacteria bacterium LR76]
MRKILTSLFLAASLAPLVAQDFSAEKPKDARYQTTPIVIQQGPSIEGIVADIFNNKKPWQMINPAAPAKYGSGQKFVSKDFGPGTPYHSTGVVVAGVEW